jgi:hypothetical protein
LILDILVRGYEEVEFPFGKAKQIAIGNTAPPSPLRRLTLMIRKEFMQRPRDTFVEEDFQAAVGETNAASDRSRTRRAISRVTDGKHSRNSSSV